MDTNIEAILKSVYDHEERIKKLEQLLIRSSEGINDPIISQKKLSLRELMRKVKYSTSVEKTLLVGYYLEFYEKYKSFNTDDIKRAFDMAKEPMLSNTLAFINQNIKNGNIMESKDIKDERKAYTLTASGEDLIKKLISEPETRKKATVSQSSPKKKLSGGTGAKATLAKLMDGDFFTQPRTINDIIEHCKHNLARSFKANGFSGKLASMVRSGELTRKKNKEEQYEYNKP